ncbi:DUF5683 domain-containing protein [uncultured Maribacter sp.]|uniref:DUF5683 domain-containing protein n=1 Tax=uncultured Maribacter sp. TaxID=431308 RepID=UPI00260FC3BF|nr:DUF5683 domain-containing protein [uncultured Maribacter sp.]
MNKYLVIFGFLCISSWHSFAQEENKEIDSLQTDLKKEGIVIDKKALKKKKNFNPLAPSKAAFYSAVLPGLGQIYNKRYWKAPIVWIALGSGIYGYTFYNDRYDGLRTAFKRRQAGFTDDLYYNPTGAGSNTHLDINVLERQQERTQESRDLVLVYTIAAYILNIVDANVDAHLQQFNVDDDLSIDFKPFFDLDPITSNPNYGMGLTINF